MFIYGILFPWLSGHLRTLKEIYQGHYFDPSEINVLLASWRNFSSKTLNLLIDFDLSMAVVLMCLSFSFDVHYTSVKAPLLTGSGHHRSQSVSVELVNAFWVGGTSLAYLNYRCHFVLLQLVCMLTSKEF